MKLKTWLERQGIKIPEDKRVKGVSVGGERYEGYAWCYDEWANIEVPEVGLDKDKIKLIMHGHHGYDKTCHFCNDIPWLNKIVDEICSLLPDGKRVSAEELAPIILKHLTKVISTQQRMDDSFDSKPEELAIALADFINKESK